MFLDIFANGKQQFLIFERNGYNGQNPLLYGVFVNDSAGLIQHFLPQIGEVLFFGHTILSLRKNLLSTELFTLVDNSSDVKR